MKRKAPLEKAAEELDNIKALLAQFEHKRTVKQHEKLAFKISLRTAWFNDHLNSHIKAVRGQKNSL